MSASVVTAIHQLAFPHRRSASGEPAGHPSGAWGRASGPAQATAWPVRREATVTLFRCRMWDGVCVSDPFLLRAPHGFLSAEPAGILATLARANEEAANVLRRAGMRDTPVAFNEERHDSGVVARALDLLAAEPVQ